MSQPMPRGDATRDWSSPPEELFSLIEQAGDMEHTYTLFRLPGGEGLLRDAERPKDNEYATWHHYVVPDFVMPSEETDGRTLLDAIFIARPFLAWFTNHIGPFTSIDY